MRQSPYVHEVAIEGWAILLANIIAYHRVAFALPLSGTYSKPSVCKQSVYEFSFVLALSFGKPFVLDNAPGHAKNARTLNIMFTLFLLPHDTALLLPHST
jgi:hypothetical protein